MNRTSKFLSFVPFYSLLFLAVLMLTLWGSRAVTSFAENATMQNGQTIIIDAGHGGEDGGATSCTGVLESSINLEIALRLNDLMHLLGYKTIMVRNSDMSVCTEGQTIAARKASDLKERVRLVNETDNALLVSIHQNQFSDSQYSGAQVFYPKTEGSEALAKTLQKNMAASLNLGSKRQAKKASGVYLMEHVTAPGILIECGFLSNPEEEAKLRSAEYQMKLCCVIAASVSSFLVS